MEIPEINNKFEQLCSLVTTHRLSDAFRQINELINNNKCLIVLQDKIRNHAEIYTNLLKYSFTNYKDPDRDSIYSGLLKSLFGIIDEIKILLLQEKKYLALNTLKQEVDFDFYSKRQEIEKAIRLNDEPSVAKMFKRIWLSGTLSDEDFVFLTKLTRADKISWVLQSILVSSLTISLLRSFDERKLELLFQYYNQGVDKVWQRALVGIVFSIYLYSDRLSEYTGIITKIDEIKKDKDFNDNLQFIVLQVIRTKETEKISKKLHNEIIPEVAKFKPKIEEKLRLDDIFKDALGEEKNPDWEGVFEDSPDLISKLEEISKMQIEGSDVFMSAFAMLKHFDFFKEPANWFLPFYKENKDIYTAFSFEKEGFNKELFIEGLERSAFLCNSDKYSFVLNVRYMPEIQKSMMLEMFNAELESMNELIKDDEILNKASLNKYIINQYIQDLYRFYKLFPGKNEFTDVFDRKLEMYQGKIFLEKWFNIDLYKNIGQLYFKKEYYEESILAYKILINNGLNEQSAFEKIAYSYQKLKDFENALIYYKKSELFGSNLNWTYKKLALCYRELGNNEMAIENYLKAEKNEPENLYVQANLGHSYLRISDYENALKYYFKVEYFAPSNTMILRPIAWCSFVLGKFENAIKYYNKLVEKDEAEIYDYINLGHVYWSMGNIELATKSYKESIQLANKTGKSIRKDFLDDREFLIKHGILEFEIELMLDYLYFEQIS